MPGRAGYPVSSARPCTPTTPESKVARFGAAVATLAWRARKTTDSRVRQRAAVALTTRGPAGPLRADKIAAQDPAPR
jgi:hypothetical protein